MEAIPRGARAFFIPGNHDAYVAEGIAHFATVFDEYHRADVDWTWTDADRDPATQKIVADARAGLSRLGFRPRG